jgi:lipid A 3-O-deacylase
MSSTNKAQISFSVVIMATILLQVVHAETVDNSTDKQRDGWYSLTFENDAFGVIEKSDDGYSNGIAFAWGYGSRDSFSGLDIPRWIESISGWTYLNGSDDNSYSVNYTLAQGMYTPGDLEETELIEDDRPYAGTLLWATRIHSFDSRIANSLGLTLGVAGPASLAEQSQKVIHQLIGAREPMGWDNQIENEPVFRVDAENILRLVDFNLGKKVEFDTNLYSQAGVGNLRSDVGTGLAFRVGNQLDQSFAYIKPVSARGVNTLVGAPSNDLNWQLVASIYGSYVFNDITVDGNTFKDSHSVELINEQGIASLALAVSWKHWGFIFSTQRGSDIFDGQQSQTNYGSLSITYHP